MEEKLEENKISLPKFIVLQSKNNNKYLIYLNHGGEVKDFLQFSGEEIVSPFAKFQVETAKIGKGLVNIRSCYNNKYWRRSSSTEAWIAAKADEPDENQSKWSCTLFEPVYVDDKHETVRFRHVQLGKYARLSGISPPLYTCLYCDSPTPHKDNSDVFKIINWDSLVILPKYVAFKGDNERFIRAEKAHGHEYLQFSGTDIGDPRVFNEVFTTSDGSVRFKSKYFDRFWRHHDKDNWIWAYATQNPINDINTWFSPVKVSENVIALRNLGNNKFCKRLSKDGKTSYLNADIGSITIEGRLKVEEPVISRSVYNVDFRLNDARIYDQTVLTMAQGDAVNDSTQTTTIALKLQYTQSKSSNWDSSVSIKLGASITFETGIPLIFEGKVQLSGEFSGSYRWGSTDTSTTTISTDYTVSVPPKTRVKVSLIATQGHCDVPFSYTQFDTLTDGRQVSNVMDDGVYKGMNCYNFKYETKETKLIE